MYACIHTYKASHMHAHIYTHIYTWGRGLAGMEGRRLVPSPIWTPFQSLHPILLSNCTPNPVSTLLLITTYVPYLHPYCLLLFLLPTSVSYPHLLTALYNLNQFHLTHIHSSCHCNDTPTLSPLPTLLNSLTPYPITQNPTSILPPPLLCIISIHPNLPTNSKLPTALYTQSSPGHFQYPYSIQALSTSPMPNPTPMSTHVHTPREGPYPSQMCGKGLYS